jgi:hypothetical protein
LKKWGIKDDETCDLCTEGQTEHILHYLVECPYNKNLLKSVVDRVMNVYNIRWEVTDIELITGLWITQTNDELIKLIDKHIYFCKMFIIISRRNNSVISLKTLSQFLIKEFDLESELEECKGSILYTGIVWDKIFSHLRK